MKKLAVMISMVALIAACGGEEAKEKIQCSADCNGALAAAPNLLCTEFNSNSFESGTVACNAACEVDTTQCVEISNVGAAEFQQCSGATSGSPSQGTCEDELHCLPFLSATTGYCMTPCTTVGDDAICGAGTCVELTSGNYCFKKDSMRDQVCFENLSECVDGAGDCTPTSYDYDAEQGDELRCKVACDGANIGEQDACPAGETCLQNTVGWLDVQNDAAGNAVDCVDDASCEDGYSCMDLTSGKKCAKYQGWCGNAAVLCGTLGQSGIGACAQDQSKLCTPDNGHNYCGISGTATDADEAAGDAYAYCLDIGGGFGVCVGICETEEGNANCGEGYSCVEPAEGEEIFFKVEEDAQGNDLTCADDTACSEGFKCNNLSGGQLCSKPYKLCKEGVADAGTDDDTTTDAGDDAGNGDGGNG